MPNKIKTILFLGLLGSLSVNCGQNSQASLLQSENPESIHPSYELQEAYFLISRFEQPGMTNQELIQFLNEHGFHADQLAQFVHVTFHSGKDIFLTPNGTKSGLADLLFGSLEQLPKSLPTPINDLSQPQERRELYPDHILTRQPQVLKSKNQKLIHKIQNAIKFPVTPLGMCYEGSQHVATYLKNLNVKFRFTYFVPTETSQGHMAVLAQDPDNPDGWIAVDSYFGVGQLEDWYYHPDYMFEDFSTWNLLNPHWLIL